MHQMGIRPWMSPIKVWQDQASVPMNFKASFIVSDVPVIKSRILVGINISNHLLDTIIIK